MGFLFSFFQELLLIIVIHVVSSKDRMPYEVENNTGRLQDVAFRDESTQNDKKQKLQRQLTLRSYLDTSICPVDKPSRLQT